LYFSYYIYFIFIYSLLLVVLYPAGNFSGCSALQRIKNVSLPLRLGAELQGFTRPFLDASAAGASLCLVQQTLALLPAWASFVSVPPR